VLGSAIRRALGRRTLPSSARPEENLRTCSEPDTSDAASRYWRAQLGGYAVTGLNFHPGPGFLDVPLSTAPKPRTPTLRSGRIDGWNNGTVEQLGTDSDCNGTKPSFYAWYEFYRNTVFNFDKFPVSPGRSDFRRAVNYDGEKFTLTITNQTTNLSASRSGKVPQAKRASAEWIAEAPAASNDGNFLLSPISHHLLWRGLPPTPSTRTTLPTTPPPDRSAPSRTRARVRNGYQQRREKSRAIVPFVRRHQLHRDLVR